MKQYLVIITWNDPYPKKYEFRENGTNISVAVARATRVFRKEQKGRRIKELNIKVSQL